MREQLFKTQTLGDISDLNHYRRKNREREKTGGRGEKRKGGEGRREERKGEECRGEERRADKSGFNRCRIKVWGRIQVLKS